MSVFGKLLRRVSHLSRGMASAPLPDKKNQSVLFYATSCVILFVGGSYAAVPLYRMFCQVMDGAPALTLRRQATEAPS